MPPGLAWSRWRNLYSTVQNRFSLDYLLNLSRTDAEKYRIRLSVLGTNFTIYSSLELIFTNNEMFSHFTQPLKFKYN